MDPSRDTPDMSPVDKDGGGGGGQSESIFQLTEKTDDEKTIRLKPAEETAPTATQNEGANSGLQEITDNSDNTQAPLKDLLASTADKPSSGECLKGSTDSKCDTVEDYLANDVQVQMETTNCINEKSSVPIESSSSSKSDDENILIPNKPQPDTRNLPETPSLAVSEGKEEDASKDDEKCLETVAPNLVSEAESAGQKLLIPSSEEKPLFTSEEKTLDSSSEKRSSVCEENPHRSPSELLSSASEEKSDSKPSEKKPLIESFNEKPPSSFEKNTSSTLSEETPHSESSVEEKKSASEEKSPSSPSEQKYVNESSDIIRDEKQNPSEDNIPSASIEGEDNDLKAPCFPTEKSDERKVPSTSFEEKVSTSSSEMLCDEEKTDRPSEEICVEEENINEAESDVKEKNEVITPNLSSEEKSLEVKKEPSSLTIEEECVEDLSSSSPPSEDKPILEKAPSSSPEETSKGEKTVEQPDSDEKPENADSLSENECSAVLSSSVKIEEEQKLTECSGDVTAKSSSELVNVKVNDENVEKCENSITNEESKESAKKFEIEEIQESNNLLEKCVTESTCQSDESNGHKLNKDESEELINYEDKSTKDITVESPVVAADSADIQCSKPEEHDLLVVDSSSSKNETSENDKMTGSNDLTQNKIDESSESDVKISENEVSSKSDIKEFQNEISESARSNSSAVCAENNDKVESDVSKELISGADLCDKRDIVDVSQKNNEETCESAASVSKSDGGLKTITKDCSTSEDQQLSSNTEKVERNKSGSSSDITIDASGRAEELLCSTNKETTSIKEKFDDSSLLCDEILDKSEDQGENATTLPDVDNASKDTPQNVEDEKVVGSENRKNMIKDSKIEDPSSKLAEDAIAVKIKSSSGVELQITSNKKDISINLPNEMRETSSSVEELSECVNSSKECSKDVGLIPKNDEKGNCGNSVEKSSPRENIQSTASKKEESNVAPDNVEETKTSTVEIQETAILRSVNDKCAEKGVSNPQDSIKSNELPTNTSIQITANTKLVTGGSLVVNNSASTPGFEKIIFNKNGDSSNQIKDISGVKSKASTDIQNSVEIQSVGKKKQKPVKRKSVSCATNTLNFLTSRVNRNPPPILPRPQPIASTSTFVGNPNSNTVPLKVSKATTTDFISSKPLILSPMDVQRISEMKPTNPQMINPDQLHKNICIIKTLKPATQDVEKGGKPKKVSIDCQVDESELTPVGGPYQSVVNDLSARQATAPALPCNPNNQIVVTVRGTFANATNHPTSPSIPVKIDNSVNTAANQERISEAVKFFFQGPTNLDRFFQPNTVEAGKLSPNYVPSVKEQVAMQQASFEQDRNRTAASKKKDSKKLTPILPKPPGMMRKGEYFKDQSIKLDGQLSVSSAVAQQPGSGEVKMNYAAEGGSKLQQVVDKLYLAQESVMAHDSNDDKVEKIDLTTDSPIRSLQPTKEFLSNLKLPSNLTVIPQKVKKQKKPISSMGHPIAPPTDKVEGSVFARLQKLGTVIEVERDASDKLAGSRSETSSPSATPNSATQPDYAQCLRVLDNLTQAGQILASIKKVNPKTAAKSKMNLKPMPNLKKIEVPSMTNKPNLQRRSSLPSDATNRSSPGLAESTAARPATPSEISSRVNLNENEHCLKIASNPELTIIPKKHLNSQGPPAALTTPPTIIPVVAASTGIDCAPLQKTLHFEQQLNCPPTISITTEESGGRNEAEQIKTFRFQLDVSQVREKSEGERVLNCDICSAEYPKVASLKRHYLRKHINARYISDQDKQSYLAPSKNKNSAESSSQKSNAEEDENMTGLYKCSSCRECFDEKNDLKNHMFEQHILGSVEFKTFDCSKCSETFDNIKEFVAHRKICSQKLAPPQPLVSLQLCLYCEQTFVNIAARNKHHNKFHHFKKKYQKCLVCDSDKYRDKSSLFKHMCTEHKNDYFGCENCHLRFAMEADLERHNKLKHASRKADKKSSTQSSSNEDANKKPTDVVNKVEVNQLPSENRLKNESTEVKEKVETQTKPTKNVNTEVNSKYELAKKLVRIGPPIAATASEIPDKTADNKVKNDSKAKEANKKKPEPKTVKDSKVKPEDTKDVEEKNQSSTATEDKVDKVVENISKSETDDKEGEKTKLEDKKKKPISTHKCSVCNKVFGSSSNVTRHKRLTHGLYSKKKSPTRKEKTTQKMNVFTKSDTVDETEQTVLHDVYGNVENSGDNENNPNSFTRNVKENLLHHLDGKLDSQEVMENDTKSRAVAVPKRRLSFSASFQSSERESGDKDCKEGLLPVSPKSSIEKYSFPKNYDGCGGLTSYFKDMSHLDLFTQKAMRFTPQNASFEMGGASSAEFHDIPTCLELVKTERSEQDEGPFTEVEFSGEWTRPRRYICAVCNYCTGELWDIEEHKVALHPNVWCPHNEVLVEEAESWQVVYHKRQLTTRGVLGGKAATSPVSSTQLRCTKCNKVSGSLPDFHRHVLDCGGDTTWATTMLGVSSPGNRRNRKWRPFGSRRRRQQGRRGLKRNIPNTPAKQPGMKIRTKPGDMETIQRMIANLPAKRVSRRVFGDDNEVKTRSQGTISSGSIYSTPFTYQFNNKTAALAKKQAAKLIKPKIVTNVNLSDSPKKDDKKTKSSSEASEKPQTSKKSQSKESAAESPKSKKLKTPDKIKSGTSEKTADPNTQVKSSLKREHSRVDKGNSPGKEDNIGAPEAKKKQKLKHNAFNVKEGASEKSADKLLVSGKSKLQTWDMTIVENKSVLEVGKNESTNPSTSVSRPKASSKPTKQDSDRQKRSSDDFRKSLDDFRKRMCIDGNLIMCSGCGTQFDNSSACQRHMKKCSYCTGKAAGGLSCSQCNSSFSSEELKLAHVCDDRAMPQLSPEEPYPVATEVPAATEDIPVLSPEEIGKNKNENNNEDTKKGPRLTRSESRASISESLKSEKLSSEETKSPVTTRNSRSSLRQKPLGELNKLAQDETSNVDSSNKQISRVLRHRSITSVSGPDDDDGGDSKTTAAKLDESSDVSTKNTPKPTVTRGKKRPLEDDVETNDKGDEENSRRETRRGSIMNKISKLDSSETEKDEISSNENRRKSTRLSLPNEINTENNAKKISMEFLKETSETGERQGKRFLCEVCDKVIMEIYLRKHVEAGIHARNVELRGDFDNLFPDEQKFITSCDICNLSFSSPFLSYKHKLQHHEDSLMELIETSMIEPIKKEIKQEVMEVEDEDDNESLIKTKDKLMSKKASEGKPKIDDSLNNVSKTKVDSNKSKTKGADAPSTETEKTSNKRKSLSSSLLKEDEKANKGEKNATGSSLSDVTVKSEDTTSGNSDKRALRARRNSLPNEPTTKSEDNMILNPELRLLREGRRSSLRLDSSLGKPKETVESEKPIESVPSKNESTKESSVTNTDLQLRGRRSLPSADSSGTVDNKDNSTTEVNKSLNQSSSANDSTGECEDGPVTRSDSATRKAAVIAPSTESTDKEDEVVHEATEFVNKSGKPMMSCFICDRSVGKYAYNKHSNSVIHNQNTKFRKEFLEKYADSKVITCPECKVDFSNSYFCFRHTMELHPEIVVRMFGSVRTTRSLSSKEEKQVIIDTDTDKKVLSSKETPSIQHSTNNKQSSGKETLVSPTASNKKTSILSPKAKNESNHDKNTIDSKKNVPTISASKDVVQTTMFEFFKKASTSSLKEDSSTDLKNANEATQNPKIASSKKSTPISSAEESKTAAVKNADVNVTLTTPSKMESEISPFDFVNETSAPILSYREVTQSKSKKIIDNNRKSVVDPTASTKYDATFDCNKKSENPVPKGVLAADLAMKSSANDTENKKIVVKKSSPSIGIDGKAALSYSTFNKKAVDNTPESTGKELKSKESAGVNTTDKHDTESEGNILESCSLPDEVDPSEVKPVNILFCATCHKRVKIESLQKHSTSLLHKTNYDQSNFEYEVPDNCDRCKMFENFPFACRAHQKSVLKSKKKKRKRSDDESSKKLVKSLLGKMSKKKLNKLKKRQKQKQSEKLAETKINRLKKMKINNWQVSVVKKEENERSEKKASSTITSQEFELQSRSPTTSEFDCLLCNKQFNSALLLVEHQNTTVHKMNASRHALKNNPLPILPSTIIPSLVKTVPLPSLTPPQVPAPSPKENEGNLIEQTASLSNANVGTDQDLTQTAGEAILAYGWQDTDWSSVRNMSGWDNQSLAGSSSSGAPDTNMSAFWETDVTSSFMGGRSSLGSILDSVNKILADPGLSTDPHYNLTDLQSEVGAYHDNMFGERSNFLQDMSTSGETSTSNASSVQENWSYPPSVEDGSTATFMDLDNQTAHHPPHPATLTPSLSHSSTDLDKNSASGAMQQQQPQKRSRKRKSSADSEGRGYYQAPIDYESKATECRKCGRKFVGIAALQLHVASCADLGSSSIGNAAFLKRSSVLYTSFNSSLVCQKCKEILNSPEALRSHVCDLREKSESKSSSEKSTNADIMNKEGAEKLKSKMSIALGSLLDKALNNLLGAKNLQEPDLNTSAIQLLGKLCAVRRKSQQNMTSSAVAKSGSSSADTAAAGSAATQTSTATNTLDLRTLNFKTSAKLRSVMAGEHSVPKLPWLTGERGAGTGTTGSSTSPMVIKPAAPSPETLVDHFAMRRSENQLSLDNSYACPVCGEKFSMPSLRNNHLYMHQEVAARPRSLPALNPDERSQTSQNQNNPNEKGWRSVACSSSDLVFLAENLEGQQSTVRPHCSGDGGDSRPVSENIIDSTSGDEHRAKKSAKIGAGTSKAGGGEKSLPALEPIAGASAQAITGETLRKTPLRRGTSDEESLSVKTEMAVQTEFEEDIDAERRQSAKFAAKMRRMVLAPEEVRVKAEAALRELSLQKSCVNKADSKNLLSGSCKYGNYRYTQKEDSSSAATGAAPTPPPHIETKADVTEMTTSHPNNTHQ